MGGEFRAEDRYIAPTLITNTTPDMKIMHEEILGPVLVTMPYRDRQEVVDLIRGRDKPREPYTLSKDCESDGQSVVVGNGGEVRVHLGGGCIMIKTRIRQYANCT